MNIEEKSCGCIIIKNNEVLLIKQTSNQWGFPKGHVEHDESEEETARREVKEETNLDVEVDVNKRYEIFYHTDKGKYKQSVFFVAKLIGGEIVKQEDEISEIKCLDFQDALETLTFENTKDMFEQVLKDNKYR